MKTAAELVDEINKAGICSPHFCEDEIDFAGVTEIETLDRDEHRWYVVGTVVYKVGDEFFGVRGPVSLKSANMDYEDVGMTCVAFEMEACQSVTYKQKKGGSQ